MLHFVIYFSPSDHPGKYVVRRWTIGAGFALPDSEPLLVCDSLDLAQEAVPDGYHRMDRLPGDDPVIVEVWI